MEIFFVALIVILGLAAGLVVIRMFAGAGHPDEWDAYAQNGDIVIANCEAEFASDSEVV